jgi:imidazolonepropionase-like amidohydrolase
MVGRVVGAGGFSRRALLRCGAGWAVAGLVAGCSGGSGDGGDQGSEGDAEGRDRGGDAGSPTTRAAPGEGGGSVTIRGARIFDGEAIIDADTVVVEGGLITAVGRGLEAPPGSEVHAAGEGAFLLPGLIDAHGHTNDTAMLADALRFGTTTVLEMFSRIGAGEEGARLRAQREVLTPTDRADFWSAGILVTAPGGHGTQFGPIPVLAPGDDADRFVADRVAEGADFVKIVIEDGTQSGRDLPTLAPDQVRAVVAAAHDRDLLAVVHTTTWAAAEVAAEAGADVLAHAPGDPLPGDGVPGRIVDADLAVIATVAVRVGVSCTDHATRLRDDPRIAGRLSGAQRNGLGSRSPTCLSGRLDTALANVTALHEAGVRILAGTDFPNPGTAPGPSLLLETELLARAGLDPLDALRSATSRTADTFGLDDRGRIRPGHRGDLLLVTGRPDTDLSDLRNVAAIWKNGGPVDLAPAG